MKTTTVNLGGRLKVFPHKLIMLQGSINYSIAHFEDGSKQIIATTLKDLEPRLRAFGFFRTHKSYIVNLRFVQTLDANIVFLNYKLNAAISRRRKQSFEQFLHDFQ